MLSSIDIDNLLAELKKEETPTFSKNEFSILVDKKIENIYIDSTDFAYVMSFQTPVGTFSFKVFGDCCSDSWFADFINVSKLKDQYIIGIQTINLENYDYNVNDGRGRQEEDSVYGYKFYTENDIAVLSFRNSSNGYYGGWCDFTEEFEADTYNIIDLENWISDF